MNAPVVRFNTPPAERQSNAQSRSIGVPLFEWIEQPGEVRVRDAAAFVLDLDEHALRAGAGLEGDGRARHRELERILKQVPDDGREDFSIGLNRDSVFNGHHCQLNASRARHQCGGRR
jgi:hypothetical protein